MKHLFLLLLICCCQEALFAKSIFSIVNGKCVADTDYVDTLYYNAEQTHVDADYTLFKTDTIHSGDGYVYEVRAYQHRMDLEELGDSIYSRVDIVFHNVNGNTGQPHDTLRLYNDMVWTRFTSGGFGLVSHPYTEQPSNATFRAVPLGKECTALVFRGMQYGTELRRLTIIVLYKGSATLVFHKEREVTNIVRDKDKTTFVIQDNWYEEEVQLIPHLTNMVFGNGTITTE